MTLKRTITARGIELRERRRDISAKIEEMANKLREEKRARNEAEDAEYNELVRELQLVDMDLRALAVDYKHQSEDVSREVTEMVREQVRSGKSFEVTFARDMVMVSDVNNGGIIPLLVQDVMGPLSERLIYDKIGIPISTGVHGEFVWPFHSEVTVTIADEAVEVPGQKITFTKKTAHPERLAALYETTREALMQSNNIVEDIVRKYIPVAIGKNIDAVLFSTTKVTGAKDFVGPFVALKASAKQIGPNIDFKTLNLAKAELLATGVEGEAMAWVMTKSMQAILEATPKDAGSGIMICEDGKIAGLPVYTTQAIGNDYIGLGDWSYQPLNFFGDVTFIVDPYTGAAGNKVRYAVNTDVGTVTLIPEAFKLLKVKNA